MKILSFMFAAVLLFGLCLPSYAAGSDPVHSHMNSGKKIALTFDDGPHPRLTPEILDILGEYGIKATFFVIGENCKAYPNTLKQVIDDGHEIGNHTFTHAVLTEKDNASVDAELSDTEKIIYEIGEYLPKLVRPPCGRYNSAVIDVAHSHDYDIVLWSIDTEDWRHRSAADISEMILTKVKSGDIILFHDYISGYSPTAEVLRTVIPKLLADGYTFTTVSELLVEE